MLDEALLGRALQREAAAQGLQAGAPRFRYADGFWAEDIGPTLKCPHAVWAPFMSGFGGISVVLLPNGVQYYYFGDSGIFDWTPAAAEIDKFRPMCEAAPGRLPVIAGPGQKGTGSGLQHREWRYAIHSGTSRR
jgi:hypothetical protein